VKENGERESAQRKASGMENRERKSIALDRSYLREQFNMECTYKWRTWRMEKIRSIQEAFLVCTSECRTDIKENSRIRSPASRMTFPGECSLSTFCF